jgi:N-methylhydantoinase A
LDREAIGGPLEALAKSLGTDAAGAAEGVVTVVNAAMEGALRVISVERGQDPADFTLVPFGGAAGLHAAALAERLGIPRILIPLAPGVLSAWGMLVAPVRKAVSRTVLWSAAESGGLEAALGALEQEARAAMAEEGIPGEEVLVHRRIDARYRGQSFELSVPAAGWVEAFHGAHAVRYGYDRRDAVVEAVTLRVEALAPGVVAEPTRLGAAGSVRPAPSGSGAVTAGGQRLEASYCRREDLLAGHEITGPAVVLEYSSTLWLPPGWRATVLAEGSLLAQRVSG